ncbi:hypothetical protein HZA57_00550 [Candidatus Poribacteria bacterium]|nr:hypothetical protein [Candidatus Poribacteria bacterium]
MRVIRAARAAFLLVVLMLLASAANAERRIWHVKQDGTGDFTAIQPAMDAASPGDIVTVHPGTYQENLRFNGKDIILKGTKPWDRHTVFETAIEGIFQDNVVTLVEFSGPESSRSAVLGSVYKSTGHCCPRCFPDLPDSAAEAGKHALQDRSDR